LKISIQVRLRTATGTSCDREMKQLDTSKVSVV